MNEPVIQAVANLEGWLETMRVTDMTGHSGYGGPVVHWWQNCLSFTGPALDWRYEGIVIGYLTLWQRTGQTQWLAKACRAGDDLLAGQMPNGNFRNSCFELNPYPGGTPHEAAADLALFALADSLRALGDERWETYAAAAEQNLQAYYLERLWDSTAQAFRDNPDTPSLVPNKACTLAEALFAWAKLRGTDEPIVRYALPTLRAVLGLQQTEGRNKGAIPQVQQQGQITPAYFPYYIARCIPALLLAYEYTAEQEWLESAAAAFTFIMQQINEQGLLPQVVYPRGKNCYPRWCAPLGDMLRVAELLKIYHAGLDMPTTQKALLAGQRPSGGIVTGYGFAAQVRQRSPHGYPADFRDQIAVVGWCDKAFRYLAGLVPEDEPLPPPQLTIHEVPCQVRGQAARWQENNAGMCLKNQQSVIYHWRKGQSWATTVAPEVMWQ